MKLLITGGHPTPALAVIDEIKDTQKSIKVVFVGRRYVNSRERANSLEYQEVIARRLRFVDTATRRGFRGVIELPYRVAQSMVVLKKQKPDAVLSFGGYISPPICIAAFLLDIPVFLHEQTLRPGSSNIWLSKIATKVMISFPQTIQCFDKNKAILTGNPLRRKLLEKPTTSTFSHLPKPTVLVQGGNLGSHSLNTHLFSILPRLVENFSVIHQVGNIKEYGDWETALETHLSLPNELKDRYFPVQHLSTAEITEAYSKAEIIISRSGASTITEITALHKPAVLLPLPWSAHGEQQAHAKLLTDAKVAETFDQSRSSEELLRCIQNTSDNVQSYQDHYDSFTPFYDPQAAQKILLIIQQTLTQQS
ncbi:glycosyltransferase [Candidatus Woesebacteria bacterium]|nr:glycosyltransferase [Candidatus Woesebacteria bacterium]